ncbi:MAG: response regulator [Nitrospira sp.]|nr:response regulator [Nitrospira sp.]MDH4368753.1 response regulator [Nitrospira sp.]MDH5498575.1 response regulator [Nitrospira sp.]MDH5726251.1 response regulator [Nitrospira sp.]
MPKILIADDSIAVRKVAERLLTEAGLGVTLAANGEEALAYLAKERPDLVVSDVIMPDKSGYEVCAFVRGNPTLAMTPVLLISGIVNDEVTKQAESCRANGVLKKPFQGTSLKDRVLELMAKRQEAIPESPVATQPASEHTPASDKRAPAISIHQQDNMDQSGIKLREFEGQLQTERARSEELTKQLSEAMEQLGRAKESEAQLATARQRVSDLEAQVTKLEPQALRISELEAALKAEEDQVRTLKQDALSLQKTAGRIAELESTLNAERAAAEQLVQQLADSEKISAQAQDAEERLLNEQKQVAELQQRIKMLETELASQQREHTETVGLLQEAEKTSTKVQEMEGLLVAERERNGVLSRQVVETEQAAENATRRFEEMARKLGEIAGLASQLGNGKGQS